MISAVCSSSAPTTSTSASWARIFIDNFISPSSLNRLAIISCEPPPPPPPAHEPVQLPARTNLGRLLSPPSSAFRLFAFAPAARRLWRGIRRALLVYTTTSPEPVISDAFAADTDDASSDPVCGSVFDALDTTLIGPEERHKLPVRPSDHADYGLWHARLGHFGRNKIIGPLRYRGYTFRPGSDRCECAASRLNRRRKGHPSQPTNRRVYTHFGERVASDLCGPFKIRGAVEQERPQVPEAIVRAEPPAAPAAPRGAPIAPPAARAAPAHPAVPRRSARIAARG
ncbi:hypothetical protein EMIHUDRAFT_241357 [Emiliania huxleyi CCMP1516]|uniref:GAG-pre-integrase domain-containing protein n=2 Tax=Emiliania huxleyi TaxID=2903 RepID=A0A0D3JCS7_EMIH1|nr:hypothetical protein EMIHUDRAFT_241357 [Emiliania huxleyi CCMP1516]EOD21312.1 hypothetical protein EMIHUDRAFT_241357 [Emiliania huxleyi CCMP1516]|eukprot:XP_005773741.1 hypothetical protein EMIHUDRAFT_241357 [Emiliania huxleyi CCMP1516]